MAIVGIPLQVAAGRSLNADVTNRKYKVVWRAIVDNPHDGPATFGISPYFPGRLTAYIGYENTNDGLALCRSFDADPWTEGEWRVWRITAEFSTNFQAGQQKQNPADEEPVFWIETEFQSKHVTKEHDGTDIRNSAKQLLAGLEKIDVIETWVWEKNFLYLNRSTWKQYQNAVNTDQVDEIEPYHGLLHIIVPKPSFREGVQFWRVQFRLKISNDPDGWQVNPVDKGTAVLNSGSPRKLERPVDSLGRPMDGEIFLDGDGKQILDPINTEPEYIGKKNLYKPMALNNLGFDQ